MSHGAGLEETGSTTAEDLALLGGRLSGRRVAVGVLSSLLLAAHGTWSVSAAQRLEVAIDGVVLPVSVDDLSLWVGSEGVQRSELATWLTLLDPASREGVRTLLEAPVLTRRSFGQQMLRSWAAGPLIDALGVLIQVDSGSRQASDLVLNTLERLLAERGSVTTLDVLEALPVESLRLDLDALVQAGQRWQQSLERQQGFTRELARRPVVSPRTVAAPSASVPIRRHAMDLSTQHRSGDLTLQIWSPQQAQRDRWVLLMPGLGGDPDHFLWLADGLSRAGWSVVVLEHPGSDSAAIQELLEGRQTFDGAQALEQRLADIAAVVAARTRGALPVHGDRVVLMGHSLGALTALLAMGPPSLSDWTPRCAQALRDLPLTNLSFLMQCELAAGEVLQPLQLSDPVEAVVAFNSFGSLLWSELRDDASPLPLMVVGGTLDLITPPLDEQLTLLGALGTHPSSRAVIAEGASHFSVIRIEPSATSGPSDDLFQLGEDLVGVRPEAIQRIVLDEVVHFLVQVERSEVAVGSSHMLRDRIRWHRLTRQDSLDLVDQLQ
ncbi:MAG: alpha/beta hydrolase [Synechococcus sp.]